MIDPQWKRAGHSIGASWPKSHADQTRRTGYLAWVDVTLFGNGAEVKAVRFDVDTEAGSLTTSRPGGVLWPKVSGGYLRIVLSYTDAYTSAAREAMKSKLKIGWVPSSDDTSHPSLRSSGGRDYVSNAYAPRHSSR